ncbi:globin-coupled sensor protein [Salibacterium salarium]|uniref:Globin-coupled sensor protein n=1 Tax=Salibacterium salarium TaxID=284579 RepID=A0A428N402_9BACI|nr:globin-coupled sensor protein [Salibacterium salarium]RSL33019.1 globin-coupled sensor protein [Salibacterium salarium]
MKIALPFAKKEGETTYIDKENNDVTLNVSGHGDLQKQLNLISFTKKDLHVIKNLEPIVHQHIKEITNEFYDAVTAQPGLLDIIKQHSSVERLKQTFQRHIKEMFSGHIDETFLEKRRKIAYAHVQVGLQTKWYVASFEKLYLSLIHTYMEQLENQQDILHATTVTSKLINFEQQIVLEEYEKEHERIRAKHAATEKELTQHVSVTADELASLSGQTSDSVKKLNDQASETMELAKEGTSLAIQSQERSDAGKEQLQSLHTNMNDVNTSVTNISEHVSKLNTIAAQMNEVIELVDKVSEQTNLLALNASIEATRAGEHGKGFAVVAGEIRKLSSQTKSSTARIAELIENTKEQSEKVTSAVDSIGELVNNGSSSLSNTDEHFNEIQEAMRKTKNQNNSIEKELEKLLSSVSDIDKASGEAADSANQLKSSTDHFTNV